LTRLDKVNVGVLCLPGAIFGELQGGAGMVVHF